MFMVLSWWHSHYKTSPGSSSEAFRRGSPVWQTDRQTDRQTDGGNGLEARTRLCTAAAVSTPITSGYGLMLLLLWTFI